MPPIRSESLELEALLWAWTNVNGRVPDRNTMSEDEIAIYWEDYGTIVRLAIEKLTGMKPDDYLRSLVEREDAESLKS